MSVVPTSAAAALAATAAASERASKVQIAAKEGEQARRTKHGTPTGDRIVLSADALQRKQSSTDRSESDPVVERQDEDEAEHLDVRG